MKATISSHQTFELCSVLVRLARPATIATDEGTVHQAPESSSAHRMPQAAETRAEILCTALSTPLNCGAAPTKAIAAGQKKATACQLSAVTERIGGKIVKAIANRATVKSGV